MTMDIALPVKKYPRQMVNSILATIRLRPELGVGSRAVILDDETDIIVAHVLEEVTLDMLLGDEKLLRAAKQELRALRPDLHLDARARLLKSQQMQEIIELSAQQERSEELLALKIADLVKDEDLRLQVMQLLTSLAPGIDFSKSSAAELLSGRYSKELDELILQSAQEEEKELGQQRSND